MLGSGDGVPREKLRDLKSDAIMFTLLCFRHSPSASLYLTSSCPHAFFLFLNIPTLHLNQQQHKHLVA